MKNDFKIVMTRKVAFIALFGMNALKVSLHVFQCILNPARLESLTTTKVITFLTSIEYAIDYA